MPTRKRTPPAAQPAVSDTPASQTYEELVAQVQAIVARLEAGDVPLAEALNLYEEGTQLAAACQQILDSAELRLHQLQGEGAAS